MTNKERDDFLDQNFLVMIDRDEWKDLEYTKQIKLMESIDDSDSLIASAVKIPFQKLIESDKKKRSISIQKTFNKYYKE